MQGKILFWEWIFKIFKYFDNTTKNKGWKAQDWKDIFFIFPFSLKITFQWLWLKEKLIPWTKRTERTSFCFIEFFLIFIIYFVQKNPLFHDLSRNKKIVPCQQAQVMKNIIRNKNSSHFVSLFFSSGPLTFSWISSWYWAKGYQERRTKLRYFAFISLFLQIPSFTTCQVHEIQVLHIP